jgi:CO dehydrogenase/acetyl-CoA synthase beta subunit
MEDKIATEKDVKDIGGLKAFLGEKGHPAVAGAKPGGAFAVTQELKDKLIAHIQEKGGEIYPEEAARALAITEEELMQVIEALRSDGVLE